MSIYKKLALGALIVFLISNPLVGQYVLQGIDWIFQQIFIYGGYVAAVAGVYLAGFILWTVLRQDKVNIPAKTSKKKQQKYLTE